MTFTVKEFATQFNVSVAQAGGFLTTLERLKLATVTLGEKTRGKPPKIFTIEAPALISCLATITVE